MLNTLTAILAASPLVAAYPWAMQADAEMKNAARLRTRDVPVPYRAPLNQINRTSGSPLALPILADNVQV
jgi:hypothetical protein